ncbi:MAG TPA: thioredoxin [Acidobacteriota bacterium]|nr:thioredoxin [Acidobacteriota bacterium]
MTDEQFVQDVGTADFQQAVIEQSRKRPVVVDFWASWCGPCRMLGPILEKLAAEFQGDFLLAKVDTDANPELAQQFRIRSIPNVKVFKDGRMVDEMAGALPEAEVRDFLRRYCPSAADRKFEEGMALANRGANARAVFEEALQLDPSHGGALIELGKVLMSEGELESAARLWERVPYSSPFADQASKLKKLLQFREVCRKAGAAMASAEKAAADPEDLAARYAHGCCLAASGDYRGALQEFLHVVQRDKDFQDQAARKAMISVFAIAGERSELTEEYRKRLAMALF